MTMTTLRKCWIWTWTCATRTPRIIDPDGRPMTCRVLLTLLLLLCTPASSSQLPPSDNAPRDHAILSRLPGSEIAHYRALARTNYRLALCRMQGVNGRVSAGIAERLQGRLVRITYHIL